MDAINTHESVNNFTKLEPIPVIGYPSPGNDVNIINIVALTLVSPFLTYLKSLYTLKAANLCFGPPLRVGHWSWMKCLYLISQRSLGNSPTKVRMSSQLLWVKCGEVFFNQISHAQMIIPWLPATITLQSGGQQVNKCPHCVAFTADKPLADIPTYMKDLGLI